MYCSISVAMRRTISVRWSMATTSRSVTRSSISSAERALATLSSRLRYRSSVRSAWLARSSNRGMGSSRCLPSPTYTVVTAMRSETDRTGTSIERATRSAVR